MSKVDKIDVISAMEGIVGKKFVSGCPVWFTDIVEALFPDKEKK